jgi:hypothetical protein
MNTIIEEAEQYEFTNGKYGFIAGAKWQQEKNKYSEEDMKLAFETGKNFQLIVENNFIEWIKEFKNK